MPQFFDIHSHINFAQFDVDRDQVLLRMKEKQIWTTTIGTDLKTSKEAVEFAKTHEGFFSTIGVHPGDSHEPFKENEFEMLVTDPSVVAIGECGLDYGKENNATDEDKIRQKKDFEKQIEFAVKHNKPIMIHCRNAYNDVLDILESKKKGYGDRLHAHMHFFAGDMDVLKRCLDNNFTVSFTGVITFVKDYHELVHYTPLASMMAETDAPYVAPVPKRGSRNEPAYVEYVVAKIASIREEDLAEVKKALVDNAFRTFGIAA
jgi:TatD DNase family protein